MTLFDRNCERWVAGVFCTCRHCCSLLMRSEMSCPSAVFAAWRLFSASRRLIVDLYDFLLLRELKRRSLGLLHPELELLDLVVQKVLGIGVGLESLIDVRGHIGVGIGIGYFLSAAWIWVRVAHVDETGAHNRLDLHALELSERSPQHESPPGKDLGDGEETGRSFQSNRARDREEIAVILQLERGDNALGHGAAF